MPEHDERTPREIFAGVWGRYAEAVNRQDSAAYARLFTEDAIRIVPGAEVERGRDAIEKGEQSDYDAGHWHISPRVVDVVRLSSTAIYGIAEVEATIQPKTGEGTFRRTIRAAWLIVRHGSNDWLIARHVFNVR